MNDNPDDFVQSTNAVTFADRKVANVRLVWRDVNNDGSVTTDDSALLLRSAAELDNLDDAANCKCRYEPGRYCRHFRCCSDPGRQLLNSDAEVSTDQKSIL